MTTKINGWKNRDTFLANLWLNNDINLYENFQKILKQPQGRISDTRALLKVGIKTGIILDSIKIERVDFDEILQTCGITK